MKLVTITFREDLELCRYQLMSFKKFLNPCELIIIVNEGNLRYINHAKRFLYKEIYNLRHAGFKVYVESSISILEGIEQSKGGWFTQQLLKLLLPSNNDYFVLDCKDIFIKQIQMSDLKKEHADLQPDVSTSKNWGDFYKKLNPILISYYKNNVNQRLIRNIQTPRLIKHDVRSEIIKIWGSKAKFTKWFLDCDMPSEFILYDLLRLHTEDIFESYWNENEILGLWETRHFYEEFLVDDIVSHAKILKVHRRLLEDQEVKKIMFNWLDNLLIN